jgi:hypothetical protein
MQQTPPPPQAWGTPLLNYGNPAKFPAHVRNSTGNTGLAALQKRMSLSFELGGIRLTPPPLFFKTGRTPPTIWIVGRDGPPFMGSGIVAKN